MQIVRNCFSAFDFIGGSEQKVHTQNFSPESIKQLIEINLTDILKQ